MIGELLEAVFCELQSPKYGLKQVLIDRNFDSTNVPNAMLPCAFISVLNDESDVYAGGMQRSNSILCISANFLDYKVDLSKNLGGANEAFKKMYNFPSIIEMFFNTGRFETKQMQCFQQKYNLVTKSLGYNKDLRQVDKTYKDVSKNVVTYDISIQCNYTYPDLVCHNVPVEEISVSADVVNNINLE